MINQTSLEYLTKDVRQIILDGHYNMTTYIDVRNIVQNTINTINNKYFVLYESKMNYNRLGFNNYITIQADKFNKLDSIIGRAIYDVYYKDLINESQLSNDDLYIKIIPKGLIKLLTIKYGKSTHEIIDYIIYVSKQLSIIIYNIYIGRLLKNDYDGLYNNFYIKYQNILYKKSKRIIKTLTKNTWEKYLYIIPFTSLNKNHYQQIDYNILNIFKINNISAFDSNYVIKKSLKLFHFIETKYIDYFNMFPRNKMPIKTVVPAKKNITKSNYDQINDIVYSTLVSNNTQTNYISSFNNIPLIISDLSYFQTVNKNYRDIKIKYDENISDGVILQHNQNKYRKTRVIKNQSKGKIYSKKLYTSQFNTNIFYKDATDKYKSLSYLIIDFSSSIKPYWNDIFSYIHGLLHTDKDLIIYLITTTKNDTPLLIEVINTVKNKNTNINTILKQLYSINPNGWSPINIGLEYVSNDINSIIQNHSIKNVELSIITDNNVQFKYQNKMYNGNNHFNSIIDQLVNNNVITVKQEFSFINELI